MLSETDARAMTTLGSALSKVRDSVYAEACADGSPRYRMYLRVGNAEDAQLLARVQRLPVAWLSRIAVVFTHDAAPAEHVVDALRLGLPALTNAEFLDMLLAQ
jgi:hypothetical protein